MEAVINETLIGGNLGFKHSHAEDRSGGRKEDSREKMQERTIEDRRRRLVRVGGQ